MDRVHRWLGFSAGGILVVSGLTGTLLSFYVEIERSFFPHLKTADPRALPSSYEAVYQRLAALPPMEPFGGTWSLEIPPDGGVITSRRYYAAPPGTAVPPTRMVTLDPSTLDVLRDARWNDTFFTWIYDVHMYLQVGVMSTIGQTGMGIAALAMLAMLIAGLANWLLPPGALRKKVVPQWARSSRARRLFQLHTLLGGSSLFLLALAVGTGAVISFPDEVRTLLKRMSPLKPEQPDVTSTPFEGGQRLSVDRVLAMGPAQFPGSRVVWVHVPTQPAGAYDLEIRQQGAPMSRFPRTHLFVDQYSGRVLAVYDPKRDGVGDTILNWLVPLHDGKAFGMVGRVWVGLLGLVPSVMMATALMRWRQKRSARRTAVAKRTALKGRDPPDLLGRFRRRRRGSRGV